MRSIIILRSKILGLKELRGKQIIVLVNISQDIINLPPGTDVTLRHQTWVDYEKLIRIRKDHTAIKIYFDIKTEEIRIMSPLPGHGKRVDTLSDLVKLLLHQQGQDWESFHPITLKRFEEAGLEPDACFYIQNRAAILGKERIDLATDPPPDLAIEVDLTSSTQAEDYQALKIPELWIYHQGQLSIYLFNGEQYNESINSLIFSQIPVKQILPEYVELAWISPKKHIREVSE